MKRLIAPLLLLLAFQFVSAEPVKSKQLLEVRISSMDLMMNLYPEEYLHLRVYTNGLVEYEDREGSGTEFVHRKKTLASSELKTLKEFLATAAVQLLPHKYAPVVPTIDHHTLITISITRGSKLQTIKVPNYNLALGKGKGQYSQTLINLMCRIERVRGSGPLLLPPIGWCA